MKVTVFAGARMPTNQKFVAEAAHLGREVARRGHELVFGGTGSGLMAAAASGALTAGGRVVGVYTEALGSAEPPMEGLSELVLLPSLAERRRRLIDMADLLVVLPGGIGTLDELSEAVALGTLGEPVAPIAVVDIDGFYAGIFTLIEDQRRAGLVPESSSGWLKRCTDVSEVLAYMDALSG